jgi:hypothetical protein
LAVEAFVKALEGLIAKGEGAYWAYTDQRISADVPLRGNLLQDVTDIETEYTYRVAVVKRNYRFDIALLGPIIGARKSVLAVIAAKWTQESIVATAQARWTTLSVLAVVAAKWTQ